MSSEESNENILKEICDYPIPTYSKWKIAVEKSLKGAPFSKLLTKTYEDIVLQPMYQQRDIEHLPFTKTVPGEFPFVRGKAHTGEEKSWLVAQEMNHPLCETLNEWLKNDLQKGVNAINIVINENLKVGADTSNVNTVGAAIYSLEDVETIFKDIDVTNLPFMMQCGANVSIVSLFASFFKKNNLPLTKLKGCIGVDPLAMLIKEGSLPNDMDCYLDQMAEIIRWKDENGLELKTIFIDGSPYHNSGANGVQELAFMVATAVYYIRELQNRGLTIDQIAPSICFSMSIGSNLFMELSKVRSTRLLWSNIIDAFGGNKESQQLTVHARTSQWTKTVYDPYVNMLRSTVEAFTAAVSGVDSLHVSSFDEAFTLPNDFSRRTARNIHFIIQEEALITKTMDPAGGSWYVEHLTNEIADKSWELFQQIEGSGGMFEAINKGIPQQQVKETSAKKKVDIEKRKLIFVGSTMYPNSDESYKKLNDESLKKVVIERIQSVKEKKAVQIAVRHDTLMSDLIDAWETGASVDEIIGSLGNSNAITVERLEEYRATEAFELLRQLSDEKKREKRPFNVFLTSIGALSHHKQRSDFIASFFETGGFTIIKNNGFVTNEDAIKATISTEAKIAVICGKNESYAEQALQIITEVKRERPDIRLFIAGKQEAELEKQLLDSGLDGFIHVGTNCYQLLKELQGEKEGMVNE
ncbi:methylmalonyl-CoA mutase family protein [Anaerobacillus isosaccharinicus]|uniref:Acyl-CoA mutase large subunit family protein n=1 Tax=Anaerobacillus isosaccharinicus TaxID=1532552 RepID=A0A1S2LF52_9BACI|nr:methylmalonyl-CoA mutase family protein [Anaerobacillus isosaccharinicus]MBA5587760.1 acyl-CoA mutase large subunit family protein [Anaerobacillus isosaccharinicus]QOY34080.1 acyl-CoA mutase large subunit family protein [Anaerobacillus isosaccharinicus]